MPSGCERLLIHPDLLEHSKLIPVVPALHDLSVSEPGDGDASTAHGLAARGQTEAISRVRHDGGPAQNHFVACTEHVLDLDLNIGEGATNFPHEFCEFLRTANLLVRAPLPYGYAVRRKQFIHCFDSAFVPHFLEPASHQLNVFLG